MELSEIVIGVTKAASVQIADELIYNPSVDGGVYLPIKYTRDSSGRLIPNHKTLAQIKSDLAALGVFVEFILVDREAKANEDSLRASLISSYPDVVRNAFLRTLDGVANVWIDNKRSPSKHEMIQIELYLSKYVETVRQRGYRLHIMSEEVLATNAEVLSIIRRFSPLSMQALEKLIADRGFPVPSLDWLSRKLDALRKAGLVLRLTSGSYVLTRRALHQLGTQKNRWSPDLARLLALARSGR